MKNTKNTTSILYNTINNDTIKNKSNTNTVITLIHEKLLQSNNTSSIKTVKNYKQRSQKRLSKRKRKTVYTNSKNKRMLSSETSRYSGVALVSSKKWATPNITYHTS